MKKERRRWRVVLGKLDINGFQVASKKTNTNNQVLQRIIR